METRNCQNCKTDFNIEPDDFSFYEKMKVPAPTLCPECRMIRRFQYRNEKVLFRRKDSHTQTDIFSGFSPLASVVTYENAFWYGDEWDKLATGVDYDFSKPFFKQFKDLLARAPLAARSVYNMVNSEYCNEISEAKNCYLCFNCDYMENCAYARKMNHVKDTLDSYEGTEDELCYEIVMTDKSYRTFYSLDCDSCVDVWFSKGLRGCTNCFGCVNLTKKSNYFFNEPYSKEEYDRKVAQYNLSSHAVLTDVLKTAHDFWLKFPVKYNHTLRTVASTGERVFDSKNVTDSYSVRQSENLRYCQDMQYKASNAYDYTIWGDRADNMYECVTCGLGAYNIKFSYNCWGDVRDVEYCAFSYGVTNCFGCVGLYKKQYCIFNKQYTKEEYEILREKIITHMNEMPYMDKLGRAYTYGEFFPAELSPYAYNESMAQDFYPLLPSQAEELGFVWREPVQAEYKATITASDLPDDSKDVGDSILKEVIECLDCSKAYRIIPLELQFYKNMKLPLPRKCHMCRFTDRFKFVNPPQLWLRECMCQKGRASADTARPDLAGLHDHVGDCPNQFKSSYAPERPEMVYCESCYQKETN